MKRFHLLILLLSSLLFNCEPVQEGNDDPFSWLEETESEKALDWVREKNKISASVLTSREEFKPILTKNIEIRNSADRIAEPDLIGEYVYNLWQDSRNQRGIWRRMALTEYVRNSTRWELLIDLDSLSKSENKLWVFQGAEWLEPDYQRCLIYLSNGGGDAAEIREFDVASKSFVTNGFFVPESKGGVSWIDQNTIYVCANFGESSLTTSGYPRIIKRWTRGTEINKAVTIFEGERSDLGVFSSVISTPEANYEMIFHSKSFYSSEYHLVTDNGVVKLAIPDDSDVEGIFKKQLIVNLRSDWNTGGTAYPAGSLVSIALPELQHGMLKIKPIFTPAGKSSIYSVAISKGFVLVNILKNVQNKLLSFTLDKSDWKQSLIDTPEFGSLEIMSASGKSNDYFISSNSFLMPTSLYYGHNSQLTKVKSHTEFFETSKFEVSQHEAISKDGTKIPYFLVSRKGIPWNGRQPTLLYAYGGFEVSITPYYSATTGTAWLERGGIYVVANIRGGGEFGPSWHQGALKGKRQVAYDDFYAVAEDLIRKKITSPEHLGIHGGSNGGLLVGVALTQHPELFNAVVCEVPLLDMKRYSKLLAGASWMEEYGNPDIPEDWEYIRKYSPYHNVSAEKKYPEALFITSTKDDRVHPAHARKMVAMMESLGHKVYYYESMEGGHGGASTTEQMAYLDAIMYTYLHMKLSTTANE